MNTLAKGMICLPGRAEWDGVRFHHSTQKDMQFNIYELVISGIFYLMFWTKFEHRYLKPWKVKCKRDYCICRTGRVWETYLLLFLLLPQGYKCPKWAELPKPLVFCLKIRDLDQILYKHSFCINSLNLNPCQIFTQQWLEWKKNPHIKHFTWNWFGYDSRLLIIKWPWLRFWMYRTKVDYNPSRLLLPGED